MTRNINVKFDFKIEAEQTTQWPQDKERSKHLKI